MPHATLKIVPGVDTSKTPTLNEMAVSYTNLVRFFPDRSGLGLVQKVGGWTNVVAGGFDAPIRELKAWSDLERTKYLAIAGEGNVGVKVYRPSDESIIDVTPYYLVQDEESSYTNTSNELEAVYEHTAVAVATTANLTATYSNGSSGIGATLTNSGTLAALSIDGEALATSDRVLVKNQSTGFQNGIYEVTTVGDGSTAWVLTRTSDFDAWASGNIELGATFLVQSGTINQNRYYYCSNSSTVTVGTTNINFVRGGGFTTQDGNDSVRFYTTNVPSSASYVFFPTIVNVGNVNLVGPYDIVTTGPGYLSFAVPDIILPISKIKATTSGSDRIVTVTFSVTHNFYEGQNIYVSGVDDATFDGSFTISTSPGDLTQFSIKYTQTGVSTAATSNGGTVNARVNFGGSPPEFTTTNGSDVVQVSLINHGFSVGDTFRAARLTNVGGVDIRGLYTVTKVSSPSIGNFSSQFEISLERNATSTETKYENNGDIFTQYFVSLISSSQGANYFYGGGVYNEGVYGSGYVPSPDNGEALTSFDWTLDNWGSILIACPQNGAIYYWQPVGSAVTNLSYMPNAPVYNLGAFVAMPQRQVIAYGSSFGTIRDPLLVRWCDIEDFTIWNGQANNQAGSYRIPTGSRIVGGLQAPQQTLLWTDLDLWSMTYIGQPYIYSFNKIGANAGMISQKACAQMGGVVYWMSQKQFFKFSGNGVEVIPCPVWDQVFQNIYPGRDEYGNPYYERIRCGANSQFNEIVWYFPAHYTNDIDPATGLALNEQYVGNGEVNAYVKYNVALNQWDYGYQSPDDANVLVGRTSWIDQSILGSPIGAATNSSVNINNGVPISGYFIAENVYATGASSSATIYFNPSSETFAVGTSVSVTNFTETKFNGNYTVSSSNIGHSAAVTITSASPAVVTWIDHGLAVNDPVYFTSTVSVPTGMTADTVYFVKTVSTGNTFTISDTPGGTAINTSSTGSGAIRGTHPSSITMSNANFSSSSATDTSSGEIRYSTISYIYQHETSNNAAGSAIDCGFTTGYASLAEGDQMTFIDQVWPDMKWGQFDENKTAKVKITFYVTNYPGDTPIQHGPYEVTRSTEYLSVRMRARLIAMSISSTDDGSFWRLGALRYRFQQDGKY